MIRTFFWITCSIRREISSSSSSFVPKPCGDISQDELNAIFNDENVFQDITPIYNNEISSESNEMCVQSESNEMCVQSASNASSSALNMLNEIKLNVGGNIMSSSANRLNIPRFNITPNMTNCVVNFNFGNGKEP